MDQASAFQVYTAMKKLKPSKQKNPKRLKKENQSKSLINSKKNVKEKIENALQDLELVQVKMSTPKQKKRRNKRRNKSAKQAHSEPNQHQAEKSDNNIDSDNEVIDKTKDEVKLSNIQPNPRRSSVHEKSGSLNKSLASPNAKKENNPKAKKQNDSLNQKDVLTQKVLAKEKEESRLNGKQAKQLGNSVKDDTWFKSVMAIAKEYSASLDSSDETLGAEEVEMNHSDNTYESMDSDDSYFEDMSEDDEIEHSDPLEDSKLALDFLLHPISSDVFFGKYWEKTPMLIKGKPKKFFTKGKSIVSTAMIDQILRNHNIQFTKNLDITTYTNGVRETHNPEGRAYPSVVWDYYLNDCSIRMLNPQTYIPALHVLNSTMQEFFGCFVGANLYLTPPNSQGFAPHYDDIEAFILQVEGQKRWRLYKPRSQSEVMPRYSSKNFTDAEIGKPFMDVVLKQGDLLYFPRGTIHQGETIDGKHSLHVTLSVYQKNSWADFMEKLVPQALKSAIDHNAKLRTGMPLGYLRHLGTAYENTQSEMRDSVMATAKNLIEKMTKYIDVDKAADEMAKSHIHDFLPPSLNPDEAECSILEDGEKMVEDGKTSGLVEIEPDTEIRLVRHHCARLIKDGEDNIYKLFYSTENSKVYHEYEIQYLEIGDEYVPGVKKIINEYPNFVRVEDLPIDGLDLKIQLAKDLWEKCLVVTRFPLPTMMD